jgi:hypothetical protein
VVCSVSVFCDIFVDGLQSITAAGETGRGEGSPWSAWSARSAWSAWSTWSAWSAGAREEIEAGYRGISSPWGYTLIFFDFLQPALGGFYFFHYVREFHEFIV